VGLGGGSVAVEPNRGADGYLSPSGGKDICKVRKGIVNVPNRV